MRAMAMLSRARHTVEGPRYHQVVDGIGKSAGRLRAAVPERFVRGVASIPIRNDLPSIPLGIEEKTKTPVNHLLKSVVEHAGPLTARQFPNGFGAQQRPGRSSAVAKLEQCFVKATQLANWTARIATGPADRRVGFGVPVPVRSGRTVFGMED